METDKLSGWEILGIILFAIGWGFILHLQVNYDLIGFAYIDKVLLFMAIIGVYLNERDNIWGLRESSK